MSSFIPSPQQERIFQEIRRGTTHIMVEALAGTGKTTTMEQSLNYIDKDQFVLFVAFNKHIALELQRRIDSFNNQKFKACTIHSFGYECIRAYFYGYEARQANREMKVKFAKDKVVDILQKYLLDSDEFSIYSFKRLISMCKAHLIDGKNHEQLLELADRFDIDLNGSEERIFELVPKVLQDCKSLACIRKFGIDYDDMIWLPIVLDMPIFQHKIVFVDEGQDLNLVQQELAIRSCKNGRLVVVGDKNQSIMGFAGADTDAIPRLEMRLRASNRGVVKLPLTVTRRCPKLHVKLAQMLVKEFESLDSSSDGILEQIDSTQLVQWVKPEDMVICRTNAPLVELAYDIIHKRRIRVKIRGRDFGEGLEILVNKVVKKMSKTQSLSIDAFKLQLEEFQREETARLLLKKRNTSTLEDKIECLLFFANECSVVPELIVKIKDIFDEFDEYGKPRDAVILSSVHRAKGLEANNVYILAPELMPHRRAKAPWQQVEERNITYVAVSRAKEKLSFVGPLPRFFEGNTVPISHPKSDLLEA